MDLTELSNATNQRKSMKTECSFDSWRSWKQYEYASA